MAHRRLKYFIISFLLICVVISSFGLVNSTWKYSESSDCNLSNEITLGHFQYSEYLPNPEGDSAEEATNNIIDGPNGLNNPDSSINEAIRLQQLFGHDNFSSVDIWRKHQMKEELGLDDQTNFLIEFPDDETRIVYTTTVIM